MNSIVDAQLVTTQSHLIENLGLIIFIIRVR